DLRVVVDVEEVGAAQMGVAGGLAGPEPGRVDLALEGRVEAAVPVELQLPVDVLEQAAHPGDHHVAGAELRLRVPRLEHPSGHSDHSSYAVIAWVGETTEAPAAGTSACS